MYSSKIAGCRDDLFGSLSGAVAAGDAFDRVSKEAAEARGQNRAPDAIGLYRQAVKMRPSWAEGWWFLGELLYGQDQHSEARYALRRLVSLDYKTGPGFALLGLCEYETKEYERALDHINEGRRLGLGEDPQARRVVLYHTVLLLTQFQQYESALQVLEKVVKTGEAGPAVIEAAGLAGLRRPILPQDVPPSDKDLIDRAGRAVCAMAGHGTENTQKYFAELLANYPKTPNVHYLYGPFPLGGDAASVTIALEYEKRGEPEKALPYAQRAVETARQQAADSPQVRFSLAAAYAIAGRKSDAARERAEFVRLKQLADETMGK